MAGPGLVFFFFHQRCGKNITPRYIIPHKPVPISMCKNYFNRVMGFDPILVGCSPKLKLLPALSNFDMLGISKNWSSRTDSIPDEDIKREQKFVCVPRNIYNAYSFFSNFYFLFLVNHTITWRWTQISLLLFQYFSFSSFFFFMLRSSIYTAILFPFFFSLWSHPLLTPPQLSHLSFLSIFCYFFKILTKKFNLIFKVYDLCTKYGPVTVIFLPSLSLILNVTDPFSLHTQSWPLLVLECLSFFAY